MKLLLDTNIVAFLLFNKDELHADVVNLLNDYSNTLYTSSVCVHELIHLCQIGKVKAAPEAVIREVGDAGVSIVPAGERHLTTLASLPLYDDHRDPNDRLIIAQAIADRIPLVSSDRKFAKYGRHGLEFIFNER